MMIEYLFLLVGVFRMVLRSRADLVAEKGLLPQQFTVLRRPTWRRPRLCSGAKLFWGVMRALRHDWRQHLVLVRPDTVVRWQRHGWKVFWRWHCHGRLGRPRLSAEAPELIARLVRKNPQWGSERIRGELLKLGIVVSKRSIQRYR